MFIYSYVRISQSDGGGSKPEWFKVRLLQPKMLTTVGVAGNSTDADNALEKNVYSYINYINEPIQYWGKWKEMDNSLDSNHNYTIGTSSAEARFWAYSYLRQSLSFVNVNKITDGSFEFQTPIVLQKVQIDGGGFSPFGKSPGGGDARPNANLSGPIKPGQVTWEQVERDS